MADNSLGIADVEDVLNDMAERTGIDRATISKLETGKLANPTIGTLRTYARALGRRLTWSLEAAEVANP